MRKTLTISGREVELSTSGLVPILYKKEFKSDFFADVQKIDLQSIDVEIFYRFLWVFARIADKELPSLEDWVGEFDVIPIMDIAAPVIEMVTACISSSKKGTAPKKKTAAKA